MSKPLQLPNAHIVKGQIAHIVPDGVVMADGIQVKVLVYATGFDAHAYMRQHALSNRRTIQAIVCELRLRYVQLLHLQGRRCDASAWSGAVLRPLSLLDIYSISGESVLARRQKSAPPCAFPRRFITQSAELGECGWRRWLESIATTLPSKPPCEASSMNSGSPPDHRQSFCGASPRSA